MLETTTQVVRSASRSAILASLSTPLFCRQRSKSRPGLETTPPEANSFRSGCQQFCCIPLAFLMFWPIRADFGVDVYGPDEGLCWVYCGGRGLTRRSHISTLKQSPESRRYGCDPGPEPGDRAGQQARHSPTDELPSISGRMVMPNTARRTPWPRASGPSSRTTGGEPGFTVSGCGCAPVRGEPSSPAGAVRAVALCLPDRRSGFPSGAFRTQPHEAVDGV